VGGRKSTAEPSKLVDPPTLFNALNLKRGLKGGKILSLEQVIIRLFRING